MKSKTVKRIEAYKRIVKRYGYDFTQWPVTIRIEANNILAKLSENDKIELSKFMFNNMK